MIFDASAILNLARRNDLEKARQGKTSSLIFYEIGNSLWKEAKLLKRITLEEAIFSINSIVNFIEQEMTTIRPDYDHALEIAIKNNITFYDASYISLAIKLNDILVTDDKSLAMKIQNIVKVKSSREIK